MCAGVRVGGVRRGAVGVVRGAGAGRGGARAARNLPYPLCGARRHQGTRPPAAALCAALPHIAQLTERMLQVSLITCEQLVQDAMRVAIKFAQAHTRGHTPAAQDHAPAAPGHAPAAPDHAPAAADQDRQHN